MILLDGFEIRELWSGFEAVFDGSGQCIGVVVPSRKYPFKKMFFAYADAEFFYGMSSEEAVMAFLRLWGYGHV